MTGIEVGTSQVYRVFYHDVEEGQPQFLIGELVKWENEWITCKRRKDGRLISVRAYKVEQVLDSDRDAR